MSSKITVDGVLERGVSQVLPSKSRLKKAMEEKKLTLYQGFDPTNKSLHIGHFIGIRKLAKFQKLGHKVIFLIGDFTAMIGDPTDKASARQMLTVEDVKKNFKDYKDQIENIIDFEGENKAEVKYNSTWLSKLDFEEIIGLAGNFTVQQMIERDFFQKRLNDEKPIYLHEFLYPLMQGYDSVVMDVDLEIGGSDQLFNMLAGRSLMKSLKGKEKFVLSMKLLEDPAGTKMGKTEGNAIFLSSTPTDLYGKIMALPDTFIKPSIELLTDLPLGYDKDKSPLEVKKTISFSVVEQIHSEKMAKRAQKEFESRFQKNEGAIEPVEIKVKKNLSITEAVCLANDISKSQAKRLIMQGAVDVNGNTEKNPKKEIQIPTELKIGKARFVKLVK